MIRLPRIEVRVRIRVDAVWWTTAPTPAMNDCQANEAANAEAAKTTREPGSWVSVGSPRMSAANYVTVSGLIAVKLRTSR